MIIRYTDPDISPELRDGEHKQSYFYVCECGCEFKSMSKAGSCPQCKCKDIKSLEYLYSDTFPWQGSRI